MKKINYFKKVLLILVIILGIGGNTFSQWSLSYGEAGNCFTSVGPDVFLGTWFIGVQRSTNLGQQWGTTNFPYPRHVLSLTSNSYGIFAGTDSYGIYVSTNEGAPWVAVNNGLTQTYNERVLFSKGNIVFAGNYSGVFVTTNNGSLWTPQDNGLTSLTITSFASNSNFVFTGTGSGGVFLSSDNGMNWNAVNNGITNLNITALAANGNNIFAGTSGSGVFFSSNNGSLWAPVNNGLTFQTIGALAISNNDIFAGVNNGGVFFSSNNGQSWTAINDGLTVGSYFKSLMIANNFIFASMDNSVYRRPLSELTGIKPVINNIPDKFSLLQNYPNPFNPSTIINYQLPKNSDVKLIVYDLLGQEVRTLVNEKQNAGNYQVQFDGSDVPSGVYFYKLQAGNFVETKKMILIK